MRDRLNGGMGRIAGACPPAPHPFNLWANRVDTGADKRSPLPPSPSPMPLIRQRSWFAWTSLVVVTGVAVVAFIASSRLHEHSRVRHEVVEELGDLETMATGQAAIVWRGMTIQLVEDRLKFSALRGEEQRGRVAVYQKLKDLRELDSSGEKINAWLGFGPGTDELDALENATGSFLSGVQGAMGQMTLSPDRIRQRLGHWDMNFGTFKEALEAVKKRDVEIAIASSDIAQKVTGAATVIRLLALTMLVLRLSRMRAQRQIELGRERLQAVAKSEARFRELLQNASDIILVVEPDGRLRYATPSARVLEEALGGSTNPSELALEAARAIESAVEQGAVSAAENAIDVSTAAIENLIGLSVHELLAGGRSEVEVPGLGGERRVYDVHARDLTGHEDIGGVVLCARDVTERRELEDQLRHQAHHDPLTNLPNRRMFQKRYDALSAQQKSGAAVLFVDLDGFKLVNDSYGHKIGDDLLISVACRVQSCMRVGDVLARQGGDEFLILYSGGDARVLAESIQNVLAPPFQMDGKEIFVTASMGVVSDLTDLDAEQAAQRADIAMYRAKAAGKAQAITFADEMLSEAPERLALESDFRKALERDEFTVVYQPKVGLQSGVTESLEALVRWIHPERGFVGPDLFIPFAEETGLIFELGRIVLEKACMDAKRWNKRGVVVAVNLSPVQFRNPRLVDEVRSAIEMSGINPALLELEITESAVLGDVANTIGVLSSLKELGVRLAIDDFGTGYSNLAHLKHFNVDVLKIDQAFVRGGSPSSMDHLSDGAIVEAVIGMAKAFDMHVVAEGVETINHVNELRDLGADLGQGYFFSKPVGPDDIDSILAGEAERVSVSVSPS